MISLANMTLDYFIKFFNRFVDNIEKKLRHAVVIAQNERHKTLFLGDEDLLTFQ